MGEEPKLPTTKTTVPEGLNLITLGAGCFWCVEAVFQRLKGVEKVISGYAGGLVEYPTYEAVCTGTTGHAEVIQVYYDPVSISLPVLLEVFWGTHQPTSLNKQGSDEGPHYRSVIYFHSAEQEKTSSDLKAKLNASKVFEGPLLTEISSFTSFYPAEAGHQDYYNRNGGKPYCQFVVKPKIDQLKNFFAERLK